MLYDSFLIIAILIFFMAFLVLLNRGEAVNGPIYTLYLLMVIFFFYSWFWSRSGQTLGMKVWKIRLINDYGYNPSWPTCLLRLIFSLLSFACFGLGYLWRLYKPYTWHDRLSQTRVIDVKTPRVDNSTNE